MGRGTERMEMRSETSAGECVADAGIALFPMLGDKLLGWMPNSRYSHQGSATRIRSEPIKLAISTPSGPMSLWIRSDFGLRALAWARTKTLERELERRAKSKAWGWKHCIFLATFHSLIYGTCRLTALTSFRIRTGVVRPESWGR